MNKWISAFALTVLAVCSTGANARNTAIYEPAKVLSASQSDVNLRQIRDRIAIAGQSLGWQVIRDEPGRVDLRFDKQGKHQVTIAVNYDESGYEIEYIDSVNLNFAQEDGIRKIHPNYNRWIRNLIKKIGGF
ncbi:hypothetical protein B2J86_07850 [Acidovorax sp. SRB_14]|uniref:hypothetical protein n=1 Tax=Acidovorax sp. SRB_14 TaxID=1962699 RepID=UPI001565172B|nr:hypothetical protein [Acidovorax sp. SRB_14]NMM80844.1 hypothetical protein [Acidovorax sp. SRB_14]